MPPDGIVLNIDPRSYGAGWIAPEDRTVVFTDGDAYTKASATWFRGEAGLTGYREGRSQAVMLKGGFDIPVGVALNGRALDETLDQGNGLYRMSGAAIINVPDVNKLDNTGRLSRVIFVPIQIC